MSQYPWKSAFKKDFASLETWYTQQASSQERSLLFWALKRKEIETSEYLNWARNHYGLPVINEIFFTNAPDIELFKHSTQMQWTPECLPIGEWDGTLFVACLEPVQLPDVQCVLAPLAGLEKWWIGIQDPSKIVPRLQLREEEDATILLADSPSSEAPKEFLEFTQQKDNTLIDVEMPAGLDGISLAPQVDADDPASILALPEINSEAEDSHEMPTGMLDLHAPKPDPNAPASRVKTKPEEKTFAGKTVLASALAAAAPATIVEEETPAPPAVQAPLTPAPKAHAAKEISENMVAEKKSFPPPPQNNGDEMTILGAVKTNSIFDYAYGANKLKVDHLIRHTFEEMHAHYQKCMIMVVQQDQMLPWRWDENFPNIEKPTTISLGPNSIFKIAYKTQKPYHGYIVNNDTNGSFFNEWNNRQIPEHITVTPVLQGENVVGALLGIGEKSINMKASLQLTEQLAQQFGVTVQSYASQKRAA